MKGGRTVAVEVFLGTSTKPVGEQLFTVPWEPELRCNVETPQELPGIVVQAITGDPRGLAYCAQLGCLDVVQSLRVVLQVTPCR